MMADISEEKPVEENEVKDVEEEEEEEEDDDYDYSDDEDDEVDINETFSSILETLPSTLQKLKAMSTSQVYDDETCITSLGEFNNGVRSLVNVSVSEQVHIKKMVKEIFIKEEGVQSCITIVWNLLEKLVETKFLQKDTNEPSTDLPLLSTFSTTLISSIDVSNNLNALCGKQPLTWKIIEKFYSLKEEILNDTISTICDDADTISDRLYDLPYLLITRDIAETLSKAKQNGLSELMKVFVTSKSNYLQHCANAIIVFMQSDEEAKQNPSEDRWLTIYYENFIEAFQNASKRSSSNYTTMELLKIIERITKNEVNAKRFIELKLLNLIDRVLNEGDTKEQENAIMILWSLVFHKDISKKLTLRFHGKIQLLLEEVQAKVDKPVEDATKHDKEADQALLKAINGFLFTLDNIINSDQKRVDSAKKDKQDGGHIMFSYQHKNQEIVFKVCQSLKDKGYPVWIDKDQMEGNIFGAMAGAVAQASVVIMCISQPYEMSQNCQLEAQFAHMKNKPIIPIVVQNGYKADGWLGLLLCSHLYYDFGGKRNYEETLENLIKAIDKKAKPGTPLKIEEGIVKPTESSKLQSARSDNSSSSSQPSAKIHQSDKVQISDVPLLKITQSQLEQWFTNNNIKSDMQSKMTCKTLAMLKRLEATAPEYFYKIVESKFNIVVGDDLFNFVDALDNLNAVLANHK